MINIWAVAIPLFLICNFIFYKLTRTHVRKEHGEKMQWGPRLYYWQAAIYFCTGITVLVVYLLKEANVVSM